MSDPADINDRLEAAAEKAENGSQIIHDFANGNENSVVDTESGTIPTLAKLVKDTGISKAFPDYAAVRAYTGPATLFQITSPGLAGDFYVDSSDTTSADDNGSILLDGNGRRVKRQFLGNVKAAWFAPDKTGASDCLVAFNRASACALSRQNGMNCAPPVEVDPGNYTVSAATTQATWWLLPGAEINGLPGVPPAYQTDTSRLTGTIFRFSGIDQYGTLYVGDPVYNNQKKTGRLLAAQLMGASNRAAGGVSGFTFTSARDGADQASIGVAGQGYNDNINTPKTAWGLYGEGIRALALTGNTFAAELSSFNYAPVISSNPYQQPGETTGVTVGAWLSALGDYDSTAAIGVITAGRKWQKGLLFYQNSLTGDEAVVMPYGYRMGWYLSGSSGMASYVKSDILQQYAVNGPCYLRGVRGGATSVNNDLIKFESWSGNNAGTEVVLADSRLYQISNFAGGFAGSRWDWSVRNAAGVTTRIYLSATAHRPETTNAVSSGEQGSSWSAVYATQMRPGDGSPIWTSGVGTPQGVLSAPVGSMYTRTDGGANTTLYVKESGTGNTGWVAK